LLSIYSSSYPATGSLLFLLRLLLLLIIMIIMTIIIPSYLTEEVPYLDKENSIVQRNVAVLRYHVIETTSSLEVGPHHIPVKCFPVYHGGEYVSLGFNFGELADE